LLRITFDLLTALLRVRIDADIRLDIQTYGGFILTSPTEQTASGAQSMEKVASGQKLVIYAILVNFLTIGLLAAFGDIAGLVGIVAIVMSFVGMFRLAGGLGYSTGAKILLVVLLVVPLVGLITLLVLNSRATTALRAAGYKVGLLGARR
jgi:hypothetical protein